MVQDPSEFLRTIFEFLEVDPDFRSPVMDQKINATSTKRPKSRLLYAMYRTMFKLDLFQWTKRIDDLNRQEAPRLSPEMRQNLIEKYYLSDLLELEKLSGRDLSRWKNGSRHS